MILYGVIWWDKQVRHVLWFVPCRSMNCSSGVTHFVWLVLTKLRRKREKRSLATGSQSLTPVPSHCCLRLGKSWRISSLLIFFSPKNQRNSQTPAVRTGSQAWKSSFPKKTSDNTKRPTKKTSIQSPQGLGDLGGSQAAPQVLKSWTMAGGPGWLCSLQRCGRVKIDKKGRALEKDPLIFAIPGA